MSPRTSFIRQNEIEYSFWLTFAPDGNMRFSRTPPALAPGERAMSLKATLPKALFRTPQLAATITVPNPGLDDTGQIRTEVLAAGERELAKIFGVDVILQVKDPG